jgi:hypothetical protein
MGRIGMKGTNEEILAIMLAPDKGQRPA